MKNSKLKLLFKRLIILTDDYFLAAVLLSFIAGNSFTCFWGLNEKLFLPFLTVAFAVFILALFLKKFRLILLAALLLGCLWCGIYNAELESFPYADGRAVEISGRVTEIVDTKENYLTEITAVERDDTASTTFILNGTASTGWSGKIMVSAYGYEIKKGDELHLVGNVRSQKNLQNPYVNDKSGYLRNMGAAAYVQALPSELQITALENVNPFVGYVEKLKEKLYFQMEELPEKQRQLLKGLAFGDKTLLSGHDSNILSQTGVAHVFAVSGLHVGFVIAFALGIINLLKRRLRLPKLFQLGLTALFTLFYALMCGFTYSVIRAVVMGLAAAVSVIYYENYNSKSALIYAAFVCVLVQPYAVCNIGFQLSFLATFALLFTYGIWRRLIKSGALATVLAAQTMTMPLVIYYFNILTLIGIVISPVVTFAAGFVVIFAFLAMFFSVIGFSSFFLFIAGFTAELIYRLCLWAAALPGGWLVLVKPPLWIVALCYLLLAWGYYFLRQYQNGKAAKGEKQPEISAKENVKPNI